MFEASGINRSVEINPSHAGGLGTGVVDLEIPRNLPEDHQRNLISPPEAPRAESCHGTERAVGTADRKDLVTARVGG